MAVKLTKLFICGTAVRLFNKSEFATKELNKLAREFSQITYLIHLSLRNTYHNEVCKI